jgi:hypothetical protein
MQNITATEDANISQADRDNRLRHSSMPALEQRAWLTLAEAAATIGCSKTTLHRLRRGQIPGVPRLPTVQVGSKKWVVLKASLAEWQRENERSCAA